MGRNEAGPPAFAGSVATDLRLPGVRCQDTQASRFAAVAWQLPCLEYCRFTEVTVAAGEATTATV